MKGYPQSSLRNVDIIEHHHHSSEIIYGSNSGWAGVNSPVNWAITGGDNDWGTELNLNALGGGVAGTYFDLRHLFLKGTSDVNKVNIIEFLASVLGNEITGITTNDTADSFTKSAHGLVAGDKVIITDLTTTTGIDALTVYYVINVIDATFQLSLTEGGSAVVLGTGDGTCSLKKIISQETITTTMAFLANASADGVQLQLNSPRIDCSKNLTVRAKSESGSTVSMGFLIGAHLYNY